MWYSFELGPVIFLAWSWLLVLWHAWLIQWSLYMLYPTIIWTIGTSRVTHAGHWNITVTSQWFRYRLKSPASRLFTQSFIQTQIKKTSKLRVTGLCAGNSPGTGEFPAQMASNAQNVSIRWRHHGCGRSVGIATHLPSETYRKLPKLCRCYLSYWLQTPISWPASKLIQLIKSNNE